MDLYILGSTYHSSLHIGCIHHYAEGKVKFRKGNYGICAHQLAVGDNNN